MDRSSILTLLALVLLAVTSQTSNCEKISSESYLNLPKDFDLDSDFHGNIAAALKRIVIKDAGDNFDLFDEAIQKAIRETASPTDLHVYADLRKIQMRDYSGQVMDTFLSICAQADEDPKLKPWKDYLKHEAESHFSLRLQIVFGRSNFNPKPAAVDELNAVFAAAFGIKGDARLQSRELAAKMPEFDLATDQSFNAKQMMSAIRKISNNKSTKDNFELFEEFMLERCQLLMDDKDLRELITAMDILRYIESPKLPLLIGGTFDHPSLKLGDEYNRLCLALKTPAKSNSIKNHLNKRLPHKWSCFSS